MANSITRSVLTVDVLGGFHYWRNHTPGSLCQVFKCVHIAVNSRRVRNIRGENLAPVSFCQDVPYEWGDTSVQIIDENMHGKRQGGMVSSFLSQVRLMIVQPPPPAGKLMTRTHVRVLISRYKTNDALSGQPASAGRH